MDECIIGSEWVERYMGQCIHNDIQLAGFICGVVAVPLWMVAHIVLLRINHWEYKQSKEVSLMPILHLVLADTVNVMGAYMASQLGTQILIGLYFLLADIALCSHYIICNVPLTWRPQIIYNALKLHCWKRKSGVSVLLLPWALTGLYTSYRLIYNTSISTYSLQSNSNRILLGVNNQSEKWSTLIVTVGYLCGVISTLLYWVACLPRICRVFQEKTFSQRQCTFYLLSIPANLFYLIGVFTQATSHTLILHTLPWTVGRLGLIGIDIGMLLQILQNRRKQDGWHEIDESVVSLLSRSDEEKELCPELGDEEALWVPLRPPNNTYLNKMSKIAKDLSSSSQFVETDHSDEYSEETVLPPSKETELSKTQTKLSVIPTIKAESMTDTSSEGETMKQSDLEWDFEWGSGELRPLNSHDVMEILAAEDAAQSIGGSTIQHHRNSGDIYIYDEETLLHSELQKQTSVSDSEIEKHSTYRGQYTLPENQLQRDFFMDPFNANGDDNQNNNVVHWFNERSMDGLNS
ncbi:unnamed protein product [Owenia fusiformis]|uniref:Uncharacterized protein n=1 Tax=Owenia fusiformis TaxID=6347 RepID=A0A8J1UAB3_OWEFU|nr:unnamed protein product [Owenia fusiformis]